MDELTAIILWPCEAYIEKLLGPGPCGEIPPVACRTHHGNNDHNPMSDNHADWKENSGGIFGGSLPRALVLMWDGAAVPAGLDRAFRARPGDHGAGVISPYPEHLARFCYLLEERGLGKVIYLDRNYRVMPNPILEAD